MQQPMTLTSWRYLTQTLTYHWRIHAAVALGVMAATAVLTGALLVGDSVRGSLRQLTLERLGRIDTLVMSPHFFSRERVRELSLTQSSLAVWTEAVGAIVVSDANLAKQASVAGSVKSRAQQVTVVASEEAFWRLDADGRWAESTPQPRRDQIVLNQPLANELQVKTGDRLVMRLGKPDRLAADSMMAHRSERIENLSELEVVAILPAEGLGRFTLRDQQSVPRTAFVSLETLQAALQQPDRVNAIFLATKSATDVSTEIDRRALQDALTWSLADVGVRLQTIRQTYVNEPDNNERVAFQYRSISCDAMLFSDAMVRAIDAALQDVPHQRVLTYLANSIEKVTNETKASESTEKVAIPYSTVSAIEAGPAALSPLTEGPTTVALQANEMALNEWAANDLHAAVGDMIRIAYFEPEAIHGEARENTANFVVKHIVPLTKPLLPYRNGEPARYVTPPTRANDPDLTPSVAGITDQETIDAWDPPFPFDYRRIRKPKDENYWSEYRTTPKAMVSWERGKQVWGSRFGSVSSFRVVAEGVDDVSLQQRLERAVREHAEDFGLTIVAAKQDGLGAAQGTTPFQWLFLGFSMFIIGAALSLVVLLFRLGVEQRAREIGIVSALGWSRGRITARLLSESSGVAILGAAAGAVVGLAYASIMLYGLRTWWVDAVVTPFLRLHVSPVSLPIGLACGLLSAMVSIVIAMRGWSEGSTRQLLAGQFTRSIQARQRSARRSAMIANGLFVMALVLLVCASYLRGDAQAGAFFGSGAAVLIGVLLRVSQWLRSADERTLQSTQVLGTRGLILSNLRRHPSRSVITLGMMAMASFLIVAIGAFRLAPTTQGTGGFRLVAQSDQSIFEDLNDSNVRSNLLAHAATELNQTSIWGARVVDGDDASCRNLYQAQRPRLLGITPAMRRALNERAERGTGFGFAAIDASLRTTPWNALSAKSEGPVPVILDKNTAMYGLHLYRGLGETFTIDYGAAGRQEFQVVGLLANSILQGSLIVSEEQLVRRFPDVSGYRYFLIDCPESHTPRVRELLDEAFSDQGWVASNTVTLLTDLLAVQNTYLSTFQSLGGLGLLLGTFGVMAVQLRNVIERRAELALLRAIGFSTPRIVSLVLQEHCWLLLGGLVIGMGAALFAVVPQTWTQQAALPWSTLGWLLPSFVALGLLTGAATLRPILQSAIVSSLRGD